MKNKAFLTEVVVVLGSVALGLLLGFGINWPH